MLTAWDLAGDWNLFHGKFIRVIGGRALYTNAYATKNEKVCLYRLEADPHLRIIRRYVKPEQLVQVQE